MPAIIFLIFLTTLLKFTKAEVICYKKYVNFQVVPYKCPPKAWIIVLAVVFGIIGLISLGFLYSFCYNRFKSRSFRNRLRNPQDVEATGLTVPSSSDPSFELDNVSLPQNMNSTPKL